MATQAAPRPAALPWLRLDRLLTRLGLIAFICAIGYLTIVPLIRLQYLALKNGAHSYSDAYTRTGWWQTVRWTVELGLGSLAIALVVGTGLAWAAHSLPPRLSLLRVIPILPIVIPAVSSVLGWAFLLSPHPGYLNQLLRLLPWWHGFDGPFDIYTVPWIIIITGLALASFIYLFVSSGFENINGELIEAAQVGGSSRAGVFFRVVLPLLRPSLVYGAGVALLLGLGQFTAPLLLGRSRIISVLTTDMFFATQQIPPDYGLAAAIGSPLLVFGIFILFMNRVLLGDNTRFITHGGKGGFRQSAPGSKSAAAVIVLYGLLSTVLPILALVFVSLSRFWTGDVHFNRLTLGTWRTVTTQSGVMPAIWNSVWLSLAAVAITLPVGFIAATLLRKRREHRIAAPVLDFIVAMPLSIPAVIFGVGFLMTYTARPLVLYGTRWVLILVYVTLMIPFSTRMQLGAMAALGDAYTEASRASGAGPLRTNFQIVMPLLRPAFGGAAALMFVLLTHEFAASLLVRAPTINVMGTILYDYYENGIYPLVACISLIMVGVTTAGVVAAMVLGGGSDAFKRL
ncbi:MAG: iron ABC transporter permease [Thermoleophilia bacterium]|nr:iron ABC transporter permease [Thermoleophilia bacterium]